MWNDMFDLKLKDDEEIKLIDNDARIKENNYFIDVTVIVTNERLLVLDYPKWLDAFRFGKMINYPRILEVIFEVNLEDIVCISEEDDFEQYKLNDGRYFNLVSDVIRKYLS